MPQILSLCPVLGNICITTFAEFHLVHFTVYNNSIVMSSTQLIPDEFSGTLPNVIPLTRYLDAISHAAKQLKNTESHPQDSMKIGITSDQVSQVRLVLYRVQAPQKSILEKPLEEESENEVREVSEAFRRLEPVSIQAKKNELSAEDLMIALRSEPDLSKAKNQFLTLRGSAASIYNSNSVLVEAGPTSQPKTYTSSSQYRVRVLVEGIDLRSHMATTTLIQTIDPNPFFEASDFHNRSIRISFSGSSEAQFLGLCVSFGVAVDLLLVLTLDLSGTGFHYSARLVRFDKPDHLLERIRNAMLIDAPDFFK